MHFRHLLLIPLLAVFTLIVWPVQAGTVTPTWILKLASAAPEGTPWADGLMDFKKQVEADTGYRVEVRVFLNSNLGDENDTVQQCLRGQIQGVGASTGALASAVPEMNVLELPYLFNSAKEADNILDTKIWTASDGYFRSKGLILGFWSENGFRSFGTKFGPVHSVADLKGRKMRSQESPSHIAMWNAFGATPMPMPVTEVLTSLQTGVVDGYDNSPLFAFAGQWVSATKYYTLSRHSYQPAAIVFNKAWFDALPADVQGAILKSKSNGLAQRIRDEIRLMEPDLLANFTAMKIQVYTPTVAEIDAFKAVAAPARAAYISGKASAGEKALYAQIEAGLKTYRASGGK